MPATPVVENVTPALGVPITPTTEVAFDVIDDGGVFVYVLYPDLGDAEVIHDGESFMPRFIGISTRVPITGGFRYTLRRSGGWPVPPNTDEPNIDIRIRGCNEAT